MEEDIIYGVAKKEDIVRENSGRTFFPMYKIGICDSSGTQLKQYEAEGIYVVSCEVEGNQITLNRVQRSENGVYTEAVPDQITNNTEMVSGKNKIVTAVIDIYEKYVQIQTRAVIDSKTIKKLNPKEVVFEGGRELTLPEGDTKNRYYVYGPYGVDGIFTSPAGAVNLAYEEAGVVVDGSGDCIWMRGNRVSRNQIMAIKEAVCHRGKEQSGGVPGYNFRAGGAGKKLGISAGTGNVCYGNSGRKSGGRPGAGFDRVQSGCTAVLCQSGYTGAGASGKR